MWRRVVWRVNCRPVYTFRVTSQLASLFSDTSLRILNSGSHNLTGSMFDICYSSKGIRRQRWNSVIYPVFLLTSCHLPRQLIYVSAGLYTWTHEEKELWFPHRQICRRYKPHQCIVCIKSPTRCIFSYVFILKFVFYTFRTDTPFIVRRLRITVRPDQQHGVYCD